MDKKFYLSMLVLPALLGSMLLFTVACEDPGMDQPIQPDQEEPIVPDEEGGEDGGEGESEGAADDLGLE